MSLAQLLAQLRPLMTRAEIEALLGKEQAKRAWDLLSNPQRDTGVYINFYYGDEVIDSLTYTAAFNFPTDVPVRGLRIGMTVDEMRTARPDMRLADGETGQPNEHGFIRYKADPGPPDTTVEAAGRDGKIYTISLCRADMAEALAERKRQEDERATEKDRQIELANQWKSIQDPNKMLLAWAEHCSPWSDYASDRFLAFARWLIATPNPDVWHMVATNWNWDYSHAPILWIIQQKTCDIATALEVFFLADAPYFFRYSNDRPSVPAGSERENYDLLTLIRHGLAQGSYKRSELAYDGDQHMPFINRGLTTPEDKALAETFFPPEAARKIPGRTLRIGDSAALKKCAEMLATVQ